MEKILLLFAAIALIILGARGTYKAIWNQFFPNEQIVTTPVSTVGALGGGSTSSQTATGPVQSGQQAGSTARAAISSALSGGTPAAGGSNAAAHTQPAQASVNPVESIGRTKEAVISTGIPSWWPSWLAWPGTLIGYYPGQGQTGQSVNNPYAP